MAVEAVDDEFGVQAVAAIADNPLRIIVLKRFFNGRKRRPSPFPGVFVLLHFLVTCQVFALDPNRSLVEYNCQVWRRQNGLPAKGITALAQTRDGYIWLGTSRGLVRFDGTEFKSIDMPRGGGLQGGSVTALSPAPRDGLWCGLRRGGYGFYNGRGGWTWGKSVAGESEWTVRALLESQDGNLWLSTEGESGRQTPDGGYIPLQDTNGTAYNILSICPGSGGRIWLGTSGQGLLCWRDGKLNVVPEESLAGANINAIAEDHQGRIWAGTERGLFCFGPDFQRQEIPPLYQEVRALLVDRHGCGLDRYSRGRGWRAGRMGPSHF